MFINIIQVLLVLVVFIPIKWICYKITEEWGLPKWLDYKPWVCRKCLTFWTLSSFYISMGLLIGAYVTMIVGMILTILDTVAVIIDQKNKTIKI